MRVKICGIRSEGDLKIALEAGADAVGFISGVRHKSEDALSAEEAAYLVRLVPVYVHSVLVTHLGTASELLPLQAVARASVIQLSGEIDVAELVRLREALPGVALVKAIHVTGPEALQAAKTYEPLVDALLADSRTADRVGGTGQTHDWSISRQIVAGSNVPVILAGGLKPENLAQAIEGVWPYGVDVNSGVDLPNGDKDAEKVREFVRLAKAAGA